MQHTQVTNIAIYSMDHAAWYTERCMVHWMLYGTLKDSVLYRLYHTISYSVIYLILIIDYGP